MPITDPTTPVEEPRWPRWALIVFPLLAIAVGGGLGYVVSLRQEANLVTPPAPLAPAEVIAPLTPSRPASTVASQPAAAEPPPEIEIQPEPVKPGLVRTAPKPKRKTKPTRSTPCNVYEHMDGC